MVFNALVKSVNCSICCPLSREIPKLSGIINDWTQLNKKCFVFVFIFWFVFVLFF